MTLIGLFLEMHATWSLWSFGAGALAAVMLITIIYAGLTCFFDRRQAIADQLMEEDIAGLSESLHEEPRGLAEEIREAIPSFGKPVIIKYEPGDYVEPMRCSGDDCGRLLASGELVMVVPFTNVDGSEIAFGPECVPTGLVA